MLKKHIDMALVGKNYLSVLLSLDLLDQGQQVLLLDDKQMDTDGSYVERFFSLEKEYLKNWGQEQNLEPLLNIDKYLKNASVRFIFDDIHIRLGESPAHNYRELVRKMPEVFSSLDNSAHICENAEEMEHFNDTYFGYCSRLGEIAYSYKDAKSTNLKILQQKCPPVLKSIYDSFECSFQKKKYGKFWWKLKTFLYMSQGIFQKKLSLEPTPLERFHLFLCLLSPFYELESEKFFEDLIEINLKKGGQFKKTAIREWLFYKGKPWSIRLASYEGIIHPKKIAFVGEIPRKNLVALEPAIEYYTSLDIELDFKEPPKGITLYERVLFSGVDRLGSSFPLWEGMFGENRAIFKFMIFAQRGRKVDFVKNKIERQLVRDIEEFVPGILKIIKDVRMNYGKEIWVDKTKAIGDKTHPASIKMVDFSKSEKKSQLKKVYYFGPYKETLFGSLGMLMEINNRHQFA